MRPVGTAVAWWAALMAVWSTTLSSTGTAELVTGAACALVAASIPRLLGQSWRPAARWAAWLGPLALAIPADTARLLAVTAPRLLRDRGSAGSLRRLRPPPPGEPAARAAARRALGTAAASAPPGSIVVDWPPGGEPALVHAVTSRPGRLESAVIR